MRGLEKAILWYGYGLVFWQETMVFKFNDGFVSSKLTAFLFTTHYLMNWSNVHYLWIIVMFLSAIWTLILTAPIHCRGSIYEQVV